MEPAQQDFDQIIIDDALKQINKLDFDLIEEMQAVAKRFGLTLSFADMNRIINKIDIEEDYDPLS